ncbi:hypothetical protein Nmel_018407 [Mimus melanotis]
MDLGKFSNLFPSGKIGRTGQSAASQEMSQPHIWILRSWESLSAAWGWPGQRVHTGAMARLSSGCASAALHCTQGCSWTWPCWRPADHCPVARSEGLQWPGPGIKMKLEGIGTVTLAEEEGKRLQFQWWDAFPVLQVSQMSLEPA